MKNKSFTLIELLLVIALIGLLASIVLVSLKGARERARLAQGLSFSGTLRHALGAYAVGIWDFNEESGPIARDGSGYGNDGTIHGATRVKSIPELGNALQFDGLNDYIDIGDPADGSLDFGTEGFTIELWYQSTEFRGRALLRKKAGDFNIADAGYMFRQIGNNLAFGIGDGINNANKESPAGVFDGKWHHAAAVGDRGGNLVLYFDGVSGAGVDISGMGSLNNAYPLRIGQGPGYFNGLIDEVRIYKETLTASQIKQLYLAGLERHQFYPK